MRKHLNRRIHESGEFLWLISLSDLMILLFLLFAVLFSFSYKKMKQSDLQQIVAALKRQKTPPEVKPNPIEEIKKGLETWAKEEQLGEYVQVKKTESAVTVEIKDQVFFSSGEYWVHPQGRKTVLLLAKALQKIPAEFQIGIEGHTDDIPIYNDDIDDNWELSAKRAIAVLTAMNLPPEMLKRVSAIAHADTIPLVPNRNEQGQPIPENQSKNRRVTIRVF